MHRVNHLFFSNLKTLILNNVKSLEVVDVQGQQIKYCSFQNCPTLHSAFIDSRVLKQIDFYNSNSIRKDLIKIYQFSEITLNLNKESNFGQQLDKTKFESQLLQEFKELTQFILQNTSNERAKYLHIIFQKRTFSNSSKVTNLTIYQMIEELSYYLLRYSNLKGIDFSQLDYSPHSRQLQSVLQAMCFAIERVQFTSTSRRYIDLTSLVNRFGELGKILKMFVKQICNSNNLVNRSYNSVIFNPKKADLTDKIYMNFMEIISLHKYLVELDISHVDITPTRILQLQSIIVKSSRLETLKLCDCSIGNDILELIFYSLLQNYSIKLVDLKNNKFSPEIVASYNSLINKKKQNKIVLQRKQSKYIDIICEEGASNRNLIQQMSSDKSPSKELGNQNFEAIANSNLGQATENQGSPSSNQKIHLIKGSTLNTDSAAAINNSRVKDSKCCKFGLSIDGGGMRGLIPATIIEYIGNQTKKKVYEIFDVVGGTSIGGILALGCTGTLDGEYPIIEHDKLTSLFIEDGKNIFNNKAGLCQSIFSNKYSAAGIESVLLRYFKNTKLSSVMPGTNVVVTAINRIQDQREKLAMIFRSQDAFNNQNKDYFMRSVARATSAAPTYFPAADITNLTGTKSYTLVDGGVGQNSPARFVMGDIVSLAEISRNELDYFTLSLGTGLGQSDHQLEKKAGLLNVAQLVDLMMMSNTDFISLDLAEKHPGKFLRIQTILEEKISKLSLDTSNPKVLNYFESRALETAKEYLSEQFIYGSSKDRSLIEFISFNMEQKFGYL
eukprot:TRINITY_DN3085_c0_g1_i3.p1 TRINITY_DN3085_c0_g1~~TRINITY_DN3085_c0_g1_i3.p1  ORF type:complete len:782 (-),score=98.27 TRINITY_DN3085_c0_g1_i3:192-2537(-)